MRGFLSSYQGSGESAQFSGIWIAYILMLVTFAINFWILFKGISKGIEKLARIAMPLLFLFAIILAIRKHSVHLTPHNLKIRLPTDSGLSGIQTSRC